jgi:hypothetical protein
MKRDSEKYECAQFTDNCFNSQFKELAKALARASMFK